MTHLAYWLASGGKRGIISQSKSPEQLLLQRVSPGTKVVFFGEDHEDATSKQLFGPLFQSLRSEHPELNCILMEMPVDFQEILDQYSARKIDFATLLDKMVALVPATEKEAAENMKKATTLWKGIFEAGRDAGVKILAIDDTM